MRDYSKVEEVVNYFNTHDTTVRKTAIACGISKSTVYTYLTEIRPNATSLEKLAINKAERHMRGGLATKNKYEEKKRS